MSNMPKLYYENYLKPYARQLRSNLTDAELLLWSRIRRKQILDIQFYRQKAIGKFVVDFFAPKVLLVIEIDGSQHLEDAHIAQDKLRDAYLNKKGLQVLRFNNGQIMLELENVLEEIYRVLMLRRNPP